MKRFITFEGIDGSGKSTISELVYKKLKSRGYKVVMTCEPTDSWIGKTVKKCIESRSDPFVTSFTFIADRVDHCKRIKKWLDSGCIVLCDRYADSTYAYQGAQLDGVIDNPMAWLIDLSKNLILKPDLKFLFVLDPKIALSRISYRDNLIPFERLSFLTKVNENYLRLLNNDRRFIKINAEKKVDDIVEYCLKKLIQR